jgi:hypothetical protein
MPLVQLPNGKTIDLPLHLYLDMDDTDYQFLLATNQGEEINNPFFGSALEDVEHSDLDIIELPDIPVAEKITDPEFNQEEE